MSERRIPRKRRGQRHQFFEADGVDEVLSCLLRLTSEVSALSERVFIAERVLEKQGIDIGTEIERYQLTGADETALSNERQRLIETVLAQLGASSSGSETLDSDSTNES